MDDPTKGLGEKLRRIFVERGVDFFDKNQGQPLQEGILTNGQHDVDLEDETCRNGENPEESFEHSNRAMTPEELLKMRMEILPQL
jgi:mediator of RNA polymerase II transcription subunit 17